MKLGKIHYWAVVLLVMALAVSPFASALDVIIIPKDKSFQKSMIEKEFKIIRELETFKGYSLEVSDEELARLKNDSRFYVQEDFVQSIQLDYSVPQINASTSNPFFAALNVSGAGESVCVIDTGIDRNHVAFDGRIVSEKCFCKITNSDDGLKCCNDNTAEDDFAQDDNGHGTHVASIAAGNIPGLPGVAPGAGIVAVKTCNAAGSCGANDIISGINWCVANKEALNISVISISIGSGAYSTHCDPASPVYSAAVDAAAAQNIAVVAAAGNSGNPNAIMLPACFNSVIPVGSVDDNDNVWSGHNRGEILDLMAPGRGIIAAKLGGGTTSKSGTSMATPHVSGSILLMNQLVHSKGQEKTPSQIEGIFDQTGKQIIDPYTGFSYSRIDVLSALLSIDFVDPELEFTPDSIANDTLITNGSKIAVESNEPLQNAWAEINGMTVQLEESRGEWYFVYNEVVQRTDMPPASLRGSDISGRTIVAKPTKLIREVKPDMAQTSHMDYGVPETPSFYYRYTVYGQDLSGNAGVSEQRLFKSKEMIDFSSI